MNKHGMSVYEFVHDCDTGKMDQNNFGTHLAYAESVRLRRMHARNLCARRSRGRF